MGKVEINGRAIDSCVCESYQIKQVLNWHKRRMLNLSPEYQRSGVWCAAERSNLIDTIFSGYPLPAVILYERIDVKTHKKVYDVIDGKQRLETILYYVGELSGRASRFLAKITNRVDDEAKVICAKWKNLNQDSQSEFLNYEIPCVIVQGTPSQVPNVFVRLNSTGKKLTRQEIRKAKYLHSPFLKAMHKFAHKMDKVLLKLGVLNDNEITRMTDVELLSELVISVITESVMDKKKLIDQMMTTNGVDMRSVKRACKTVSQAIKLILKVLPDLKETRLHKKGDFYSLAYWFARRIATTAFASKSACMEAGSLLREFSVMADEAYADIKKLKKVDTESPTVAYIQSVREGGDAKSHRLERDKILSNVLNGVFEKKDTKRLFSDVQRRIIWAKTKAHKCYKCHKSLSWPNFEIDHIKPHSKGGKTDLSNAALICKSCNASKGNR